MADTQNPVYTDNLTISGDGTEAHPLSTTAASGPSFAQAEIPAGLINGVNTAFTIAHSPNPALSLQLFLNGSLQIAGTDYTLVGSAITSTLPPQIGDSLVSFYRF